jgi:hypothetical protein
MDVLKRFTRGLCSQLFKFSLFFAAVAAAAVVVFGTPLHLKDSLKTSGIYEKAVDSIIDQAKKDQGNQASDVPIDDPEVQAAIKNALPPEFLERTSEQAIDGIFGWLQGKTETPQFAIDLNEAKQRLANSVADTAYNRASTLPVCTTEQLQQLNPSDIDVFSLPCLPPNINLQAERDKLVDQITSGGEFLEDTTISADDLPKENGETAFDRASMVPTVYQWLVRTPWILGGLALLFGAGLVWLHDERRRGIWLVGRATLATGAVLLISALIVNYLTGQINLKDGEPIQTALVDLARNLSDLTNAVLIKFGVVYVVVGSAIMLGIHFTKPKTLDQSPVKENDTTPVDTAEKPTKK